MTLTFELSHLAGWGFPNGDGIDHYTHIWGMGEGDGGYLFPSGNGQLHGDLYGGGHGDGLPLLNIKPPDFFKSRMLCNL